MKTLPPINKNNIFIFFIAILLFVSLNPFYVWGVFQVFFSVVIIGLIMGAYFCQFLFSKTKLFLSIGIFSLSFLYNFLIGASFLGALAFSSSISLIFSLKSIYLLKSFDIFKKIYALALSPGLILWGIHHIIGDKYFLYLGRIVDGIDPIKMESGHGYATYPFTVVLDYMLDFPLYRFMGPLDEPGLVGTISALILSANKFLIKKKEDYVILFSGILSFSLAFYVLTLLYLLLSSFSKIKYLFILAMLILSVSIASQFNDTVHQYTIDRLEVNDKGIKGDNRAGTELEEAYIDWKNGDAIDIFFGNKNLYDADGSASIKQIAVKTGLLGFFIIFLIFFLCFYVAKPQNKHIMSMSIFAFFIVFFSSMYQRPDVVKPIFIFLFMLGVLHTRQIHA